MKAAVKNYFSITKKEWNGTVILVVLIVMAIAAPYVYKLLRKDKIINFNDFNAKLAALQNKEGYEPTSTIKLFKFDPNGLPDEQWRKLGLTDRQILVIKHYETKGGRFYRKEDVKKMYSISPDEYRDLEPYISIDKSKLRPTVVVEVNTADSASLTKVYGIGPSFARRIIKYRDRLGGFYSKEQLKEVYGLDKEKYDEIKAQIKVASRKITKLNVNAAGFDELKRYPYLSFKQISAIIAYRDEHGEYKSINDMKNIAILDERILRKIEPYLIFK